jgi:hypothetical protein
MAFRPPKGVRPPQLEGKRTGRPKGSRTFSRAWQDVLWGYRHRYVDRVSPPTPAAYLWWSLARFSPYELEGFLQEAGKL